MPATLANPASVLQLREPRRLVDGGKGVRRLIHELDALSIDRDGRSCFGTITWNT